ncbi:hypothetical protein L2E82_03488 [Cichorium intybus]|uniref:Uncharacterized protein n=1 Tax=Cichorium intybus TaxID=13427 RepID=A0ACB9H5K1_CICIN|nr:hypothetical protein L2E82_03488 [Cichorium intybus]
MPLGNFCTIKEKQRIRLHPVGKDVDDRRKKQVKQDAISITHEIMKVKSLKTMFRRMDELVLKRCWLGSYWGLCVQHGKVDIFKVLFLCLFFIKG